MRIAQPVLLVSVGAALFFAGWWVGRSASPAAPAPAEAAARTAAPVDQRPVPTPPSGVMATGGYVPPDIASATPAEVEAIRSAEVEHSAASSPPATFRGIDGKPRRFDYDSGQARLDEARRQERRELLMRELQADPGRFAREHQLSLKEVGWIVDGDADFPERLLQP